MRQSENDPITLLVSRLLTPFIMLFGIYVIFHGHYSPGGGFQGGAMLAAALILTRLTSGIRNAQPQFQSSRAIPLGALGVLIFFGTGLTAMLAGGDFLDYKFLPLAGYGAAVLRSYGILIIEIGVGLAVMAILVGICDNLLEDTDNA
ncbi:MAG: MnhB domain-containing protein [Kiritimatiellae bacterium]|nr:MnhB domain-containing protein [Kiritimatiellia bacterium]